MKKTRKTIRRIAIILVMALMVTSFSVCPAQVTRAATNGIVKGPNEVDAEDSFVTTLSSGESVTIKVVNSVLTIKVDATTYTFQIGNIKSTTDAAVVNEKDGLLHILTLGGVYYVFDLYTGVQIVAYRNSSNGKYCSSRNQYAYMVYGKSLINNTYFYELLTSNSVVRELLMTRAEFDVIVNGGDPSVEILPTATPTATPDNATPIPTEMPTVTPDNATPTPTTTPIVTPDVIPTETPDNITPTATPSCNCNNGGTCNCPDGKCNCGNCACNNNNCKQTSDPEDSSGENNSCIDIPGNSNTVNVNQNIIKTTTTVNGNNNSVGTGVNAPVPVANSANNKTTATKNTKIKAKSYYAAIKSGNRLKLYKVTQKVSGGKIKTTRKWLSICLFDRKKGRMDWNSYRIKGVKKCQYSAKKHWIVIITKKGVVKACPSGKGTKSVKVIGKGAKAFKCNNRGLATSYVKKNGKVVKIAY